MSAEITFGLILFGCLMGAVALGVYLRRVLPAHYLSADTKDAVKLAMGLVATMSALVLGLLVTSVKGAYDTRKGEVIQMAAKVAFIDRVLKAYGPEEHVAGNTTIMATKPRLTRTSLSFYHLLLRSLYLLSA
jgi:hypothetical protein